MGIDSQGMESHKEVRRETFRRQRGIIRRLLETIQGIFAGKYRLARKHIRCDELAG